jgi:phage FluMu protein Com
VVEVTKRCAKCNKILKKASTSYKVHIIIRSQWDEIIDERKSVEELDKEIEQLIKDLEHLSPSLIESDVHLNFKFILCRRCKEVFSANPLNLPIDFEEIPDFVPPEL